MKNFLISTFLLINVNLYSQDINIKYKKAAQFIRDSINLCEKYNIRCSDNHQKNEKYKPITTFKVSPEINFISIQPLMYKISTTDINVKLEAFDNTYKFEKYENRSLTNLSPDTGSFMILYFSKPIKNTLIAEILPCKTLISKNHYNEVI